MKLSNSHGISCIGLHCNNSCGTFLLLLLTKEEKSTSCLDLTFDFKWSRATQYHTFLFFGIYRQTVSTVVLENYWRFHVWIFNLTTLSIMRLSEFFSVYWLGVVPSKRHAVLSLLSSHSCTYVPVSWKFFMCLSWHLFFTK